MKLHLRLLYWNPLENAYCPVPAGLALNVFDEDVGFHDQIGTAVTTGGDLEIEAQGWGDFDQPDVYFELVTQERRIDLHTHKLLESGQKATGPVLQLPPGRWDSRTHGPCRVFEEVDPAKGLGTPESPLEIKLEAAQLFFRAVYWNHLAPLGGPGLARLRGAHRPVPAGVTFHAKDLQGQVIGRSQVGPNGALYVPIWRKASEACLVLDADYRQPLVIDLARERVAPGGARQTEGDFLTITSWEQGRPVLSVEERIPRFYSLSDGRVGSPDRPLEADLSSSPWTFGNSIRYMVDGDEVLKAMAEAIRGAERTVFLSGWDFKPDLWIDRLSGSRQTIEDLLFDTARSRPGLRIRVLVWFNPIELFSLRSLVQRFQERARALNVDVRLELSPAPETRSHHQKMLTIDGRIGFVGGIDFGWGRWDTADHLPGINRQPAEPGETDSGDFEVPPWHDVHTRLEGPVVAALEANFRARWLAAAEEALATNPMPAPSADGIPILPARTWPKEMAGCYAPDCDELNIRTLYLRAISSARRSIYIEQQYLNNKSLTKALVSRLQWARQNDVKDFRLTLLLPSHYDEPTPVSSHMAWLQENCLNMLRHADPDARFLRLFCLKSWDQARERYASVYIHAKLMVIDDRWLTVGSANSNNRSMEFDTELNIAIEDPVGALELRHRLCQEHARQDLPREATGAVDRLFWLARANQAALEAGDPGPDPLARRIFPHHAENLPRAMPLPAGTDILF